MAGNGCVVVIVIRRSEIVETIDGVTVRWAYSVPGEIWRVCWEIETIWVRSGLMTEPSNGEVLPEYSGFVTFLTIS